jgi:hypothetical protein
MKNLLQLTSLASLALISSVSAVEFTYFGTNNDSFESFLETALPISIEAGAIPEADQGSDLYQNGTTLVTQFADQDLSDLSTFGKSKVTITQTTQLAGYILKVRYFKQDAGNSAGFSASGPVLEIDGDELVSADVTAEAATGGRVSDQTGFQIRAWKEAKATGGDDGDTGGTDNGDSGDSSTNSVMNPSGLAQTGANLLLTVEADLDLGTWESFYTPDGGVKTLVGSGTGVTEIDNFYFNIKSDPNDSWGDSLLIPSEGTPSAGDNVTVGYILLSDMAGLTPDPIVAIGFNDDSGTSMLDAAVVLDTAQDSRFNYKLVNQYRLGLIYPTPNGWNYGGPVIQNGSLNLGYTKYFRWTNSGNGGLTGVTKRYGLNSSTPGTYEVEEDGITTIISGFGQNIPFPDSGKISLEIFISSYDLSRSWDDTREDDAASLAGKGIQFGLANGYEAGVPQTQKAYIDLSTLELSIPEGSIGFTYIGTHNDSFENFVRVPNLITTADIPLHTANSNPNLSETFTVAEFADQDLSSLSEFGKTKVTIPQTSELAGHNLKVRFYRQNLASPDNWTSSGPLLSIDGDTLASGEVTAQAESGIGVNTQTGFLVKVWKEAKETETEPLVIPEGHIAFTFIGTNNHDFSAFVTVPTTLDASTIPAQPQGSSMFAEGNLLVAGWTGDPIGGAGFGKGKVTIPQTSLLENYDLKVRFFKADASNESGFSAAGPVITIDGDSLSVGEVTAEAASGMGVSGQTGFQVKIWKESRIDTDFDDDGVDDSTDAFPTDPNETVDADGNGIGDNADAAAAVVLPVLNISIVGTNAELSWDDTHTFDLHYSNDLSAWTNTNINTSPHSRALSTTEFFKLIESAPEPEPEPEYTVSVYVDAGSFQSPYYRFYSDSGGTQELPDRTLYLDTKYVFYRLNDSISHPFYISDTGYQQTATSSITLSGANSGITGSESFTLEFNTLQESDTLYFYCTAHSIMVSTFNLAESTPGP